MRFVQTPLRPENEKAAGFGGSLRPIALKVYGCQLSSLPQATRTYHQQYQLKPALQERKVAGVAVNMD